MQHIEFIKIFILAHLLRYQQIVLSKSISSQECPVSSVSKTGKKKSKPRIHMPFKAERTRKRGIDYEKKDRSCKIQVRL